MNTIHIRPSQMMLLCATVVVIIIVSYKSIMKHQYATNHQSDYTLVKYNITKKGKLEMSDLSSRWTFRPNFKQTDANAQSNSPIPRIIHQVWDTQRIPKMYNKWISTWKEHHPDWEYWFWTLVDVRRLVAHHYPEHLVLYDSYTAPVFRADVMRYFVLHHFGGIYVDLDMEAIKPMDDWTNGQYECVVSEENYEHTFIVREETSTNIVNGFIACRAGHPFLALAIESLMEAAGKHFGDYLHATGPLFFTWVYNKYTSVSGDDDVTVVPPFYFFPTYDNTEGDTISGKCYPLKVKQLPPQGQTVCRDVIQRSFKNVPTSFAYTDHHWVHAYMYNDEWKQTDTMSIFEMEPTAVSAETILSKPE